MNANTRSAPADDRTWKDLGGESDTNNTFLAYYPGDKYVDVVVRATV